jgi:hypothetical protein
MAGEALKIFPLRASAGIKRDTTDTEGNYWSAGKWVRFYRGLPRSMPGYHSMTQAFIGPSRGLFCAAGPQDGYLSVFSGSASNLEVGQFTTAGVGSGVTDITPSGFAGSASNVWQMDSFFNANGGGLIDLIAHAAPNLADINSSIATQVYYGNIASDSPLTGALNDSSEAFEVSGGVLSLFPYAIAYGSGGAVNWSNLNDPTTWPVANQANPCATKIIKALQIEAQSNPPSALLWSLDSLIQMSFVGGDVIWDFATISDQSSVLSSSAMVEMDGVFYWPGIDRFLTYNGTLKELPNEQNLDFFFDNLNYAYRQKAFSFKVPRRGEIWFCAPLFGATECNWAAIYNVREGYWYDTPLPADGRTAAYFAQSWQYPILAGSASYMGGYNLWQHELINNYNEIIGNTVNAIESYIVSPAAALVGGGLTYFGSPAFAPDNVWTQLVGFEPDFKFGSAMNIDILTRQYAQDADVLAQTNTITSGTPNYFDTQIQARYIRWKLSSNVQNGFFLMGSPLIYYRTGDRQP